MDINSSSPAKTHRHLLYATHLHHPQPPPPTPTTTFNFNLNVHHHHHREEHEDEDEEEEGKEPMFEKPLTPSDVGKLNRLVIPKQHAEKYFPLAGDPATEKGLLLSFEDESGKPWSFRYSYWNSSQSYVLTKGWSRYVKEKRLDAGDVVLFERHRLDAGRLFIGCRRRAAAAAVQDAMLAAPVCGGSSNVDYSGGWTRVFYDTQSYPPHPCYNAQSYPPLLIGSLPYQPDRLHADPGDGGGRNGERASTGKRVRLFGVNLELETSADQETSTTTTTVSEPPTPDGSSTSTSSQLHLLQQQDHHHHHQPNTTPYLSHHQYSHHPHHNLEMMDVMSRDMDMEMIRKGQHQHRQQQQHRHRH